MRVCGEENCTRKQHKRLDQACSPMDEPKKLHIAMFPWLAFGHIIPFLEVAKRIAKKGHTISFISTPRNIQRMPKIPPNLSPLINLIPLTLPPTQNLPSNAEATMDLPTDQIPFLKIAFDELRVPLVQYLQNSTPDWIIYDFAPFWLPTIAAKLGISQAFFSIFSAWSLSFAGSSSSSMINGEDPRTEPEHFTVPPAWVSFPSKVAYRLHEAKRFLSHSKVNSSSVSDMFRVGSILAGVEVIAPRGCLELEADFVRLLGELHGKPVLPMGLLPPSADQVGGEGDETWVTISEWLEKQKKGSVVYIALGSELTLSQAELTELALGLELSGLPFFWALKKQNDLAGNKSRVELPEDFEERVKGRGVVWQSWAPQLRILGHESVGGFLTHCGYSSVTEALCFGLPLIMLPFAIDQGLNARVFEDKKVGMEVAKNENDGSYTRVAVADSVRMVMVENEGKIYKENAMQMRKLFADEDLHDRYINQFVEFLQNHRLARTGMEK